MEVNETAEAICIVIPMDDMPSLVAKSKTPCHCCGAVQALNPHRMDKQKIKALRDLVRLLRHNEWVRVEDGRGLQGHDTKKWCATAYRARAHMERMEWFSLVIRQGFRSGLWQVTAKGIAFLRGQCTVPAKILERQGNVFYKSHEQIDVSDVTETFDKAYWDNYPWQELGGRVLAEQTVEENQPSLFSLSDPF